MIVSRITSIWDRIWFAEQSPAPIAVYRILYGLLLIWTLVLLCPYIDIFYGPNGILSIETARMYVHNFGLTENMAIVFAITLIFGLMLTCGLYTRFSALMVLVGLILIHNRNYLILNSGDTLLRLGAYYLVFANAGDALSLDRLIRKRRGETEVSRKSQWVQKLLQFQVALIYAVAFTSKLAGQTWLDGTAVYYALRVEEFARIPVPFIVNNLFLCKLFTWGALVTEASMFTLVWFRKLRYFVLAAAVLLHLGIELTMNIPIFEWLMIASLVVFVYPEDMERLLRNVTLSFRAKRVARSREIS